MELLPFAVVMTLFATASLAVGLGYRRLGEALAISTAVSPPTGLLAGVAALVLLLRVRLDSYEPGLSVVEVLFSGLATASFATLVVAIALVLRKVQRNRRKYLEPTRRSWGYLLLSAVIGAWAVAMAIPG